MQRRQFLIAASAALFSSRQPAFAQQFDDIVVLGGVPPLPSDLAGSASSPPAPYQEVGVVGTARPTDAEIETGYDVLLASPFGPRVRPIDVAQYFVAVGAGAYGDAWRPYAREWPIRANPVIFHFFASTMTSPEGDVTPWCAAFANWCILRAKATSREQIGASPGKSSRSGTAFDPAIIKAHTTNHASSGSFRCWDTIEGPQYGDVAVFADKGTQHLSEKCRGTGHVAFLIGAARPGWIRVVGGNQSQAGSNGAVTVSDMRIGDGSRFMKFVALK